MLSYSCQRLIGLKQMAVLSVESPRHWDAAVPSMIYAYHNTVHSSTGYTPHFLLFGWQPIDIRVPLVFQQRSDHSDIDSFLTDRACMFANARAALERARDAMIKQRKASNNAHHYKVGQQVKISTRVLRPRLGQNAIPVRKLDPQFLGPFTVTALLGPKNSIYRSSGRLRGQQCVQL